MALALARSSESGSFVLNPESLTKLLELVGNHVETLTYFDAALAVKISQSGMKNEFSDLMNETKKLIESATYREQEKNKLSPWSGEADLMTQLKSYYNQTEFEAFQNFLAGQSASMLPAEVITLDCALSRQSEFMRAYSSEGTLLEGDALVAMDTLFNSWLAQPERQMISKDGVIYAGTDKGEIKLDSEGKPVAADYDKLNQMLGDESNEFARYVNKMNPSVNVVIRQHPYEEEPTPEAAGQS